jgi:NAD(P)H dehydrogenase (quinone)
MRHHVVFAHPQPNSFTALLAQAYAEGTLDIGHDASVRDLYRIGFDPRLRPEELPGEALPAVLPDVAEERRRISESEVIVLVYPLWFNAPPAILKGYVDRVFGMGFGFGPAMQPMLVGKRLIAITTSGAPKAWLSDSGAWRALRRLFDEHLAEVCGLTVLDHLHFGDITPGIRPDAVEACETEARGLPARLFAD